MSRAVGPGLVPRLVDYFSAGWPVMVAHSRDGAIRCGLGQGVSARTNEVIVEVGLPLSIGDRVSVHTLGPDICAVLGAVTDVASAGSATITTIQVVHVKDDRPPGLDVQPFRIRSPE